MDINLTLIGQMITFLLFVLFTWRFVWPPLIHALRERQARIADGLAAAERGHVELAQAKEQASLELRTTRHQASSIIFEAQKRADSILEEARHSARQEGQRIIQQAHLEVERMVTDAQEELRKRIAILAITGAEKILRREVDVHAHHAMLQELAGEI